MSRMIDRTGEIHDHYKVIRLATPDEIDHSLKSTGIWWYCLCECGNYFVARSNTIGRNITTSCGCLKRKKISEAQRENLVGQKFGSLTVLRLAEVAKNRQCKWHCVCDCGQELDVYASNLKRGHTKSCGCEKSQGEKKICDLLSERQILAERQFIFENLKGIGGGNLLFDFAFFDDDKNLLGLLEYQGIQHYHYTPETAYFGYQQREYTDKAKKKYCQEHGIPLYEIKYNDNIEEKLDQILSNIFMTIPCQAA